MILTILRILYLRLRNNPAELLLVFVMPIIFFSIFAGIFSNGIATGSDKKIRVGWISSHPTALALQLQEFLDSNALLECVSLDPEDNTESFDDPGMAARIKEAQRSGKYDLIVKLPVESVGDTTSAKLPTFAGVRLVTDGQNPMAIAMVTSILRSFFAHKMASTAASELTGTQSIQAQPGDFSDSGALGYSTGTEDPEQPSEKSAFGKVAVPSDLYRSNQGSDWIQTDPDGTHTINGISFVPGRWAIEPRSKTNSATLDSETLFTEKLVGNNIEDLDIVVENPQAASQENPRIAMYAAGIAVLFLLFSATGNAAALLEEAESGTLDRILVSKASLFQIVAGKWLGILLLGCLQISVMFLWAEAVFSIQLFEHLDGFCVMTFSTAAATASFAMLLATICKSRAQLNALSVVIILSMSAVGGSMIPRFAMSDRMKDIGKWTFNAWALDGYQKVFWFQAPVSSLQAEVTVLLGSSLLLGLVTLLLSGRWKKGSL